MKAYLKNIIKSVLLEELGVVSSRTGLRTLRVFDFDDTLAKTNSRIWVTELDKETKDVVKEEYPITPAEYATFKVDVAAHHPNIEYMYDYREFAEIIDPKIIDFTFDILRKIVSKLREETSAPAVILTARGHNANKNIKDFLQSFDIDIPVITLEGSAPELKSNWIKETMLEKNVPHVEFFDDSPLNVKAVASLNSDQDLISNFGADLRVRSRLIKAH